MMRIRFFRSWWVQAGLLLGASSAFGQFLADTTQSPLRSIDYFYKPPISEPLKGLLPKGGIGQSPGYLRLPERNLVIKHQVDMSSREVKIGSGFFNFLSRDTSKLWTAYYPELTSYTFDMYDIGLQRMWLNSLIGQSEGGAEEKNGALFDISIPVNMPAWMKDLGLDKPKLKMTGQMNVRLHGYGEYDDAPGSLSRSLWPSPTLLYEPNFVVQGKIGRNITVEITNNESGLGVRDQVRVIYAESTPGEFEDFILQRVELGSTSLSLKGTELTGYSENHQGLFGIKADFKLGDWWITAIASQDGGGTESYSIRSSSESTEYQIQDKQFTAYRYYFLSHSDRRQYIETHISREGLEPQFAERPDLQIYKISALNNDKNLLTGMTAIYVDSLGNTVANRRTGLQLMPVDPKEYTWDARTGILRVDGVNRNTLLAASWSGDPTGRLGGTVRSNGEVVLIQDNNSSSNYPGMDKLMLRNTYTVGLSSSTSASFILRMKNANHGTGSYLNVLGLVDSITGSVLVDNSDIFLTRGTLGLTGEMRIPCRDVAWYQLQGYTASKARELAYGRCLEPLQNLDTTGAMASLYNSTPALLNRVQSRFYFETVGKKRPQSISVRDPNSSFSVNSGNCLDIAQGSEKLKIGSTELVRDVDYTVNYEMGQIDLISAQALDPNNEISVTYECNPLFEIDSKLLMGLRAERPIRSLGDKSLIGITALYKSQSTTQNQPKFGGEPFSSVLLGANMTLQDTATWMDKFINAWPFIDTKVKSRWSFEVEMAAAYHDANTSDRQEALLEDFEGSSQTVQLPLYRTAWYHASPPGGTPQDALTYIPDLDYRYQGSFIWHSNQNERYRNIWAEVGNVDVDSRELPILQFSLRPNDNLNGRSWGGVMRNNSTYYQDLSNYRYLEVVARGNVGNLFLELGAMSEDISINGFVPNGILDAEALPGTTQELSDKGLDGVTGKDELFSLWDCRVEGCDSTITSGATSANGDVAMDNFDLQEDETAPSRNINGTEGNNGPDEHLFDSEDLNADGSLNQDIRYLRYKINLESTNGAEFEVLKNGWRRFRIPLSGFDTLVAGDGSSWREILADARMSRLWYGRLKSGVVEGLAQIVDLRIVGNQWEEDSSSNQYGVVTQGSSQTVVVDGQTIIIQSPGTTVIPDTNYLRVRVINNREDTGYVQSPNTVVERDASTSAALKEQSLVLQFGGLHAGQQIAATRFFDTDSKDLTQYERLKLEILNMDDLGRMDQDSIPPWRFAVQIGAGGLEGSDNYYEWSFQPKRLQCQTTYKQDCYEKNWKDNAMDIPLEALAALKELRGKNLLGTLDVPLDSLLSDPEEKARAKARGERIKLVGSPSLASINWMRFVIQASEDATPSMAHGTFWVNDMRLSGLSSDWGLAGRMRGQLDFADVMKISAEANYQDGDFATLGSTKSGSPKPTLAESRTQLVLGSNLMFGIDKFLKDDWKIRIPLNLAIRTQVQRPYLKPQGDEELEHEMLGDLLQDIRSLDQGSPYQTFNRTRSLSISYAKDHTDESKRWLDWAKQFFLERPSISYSYNESEGRSSLRADSTYSYTSQLDYKLGTYKPYALKPFKAMPSLVVEPWPQTFDVQLMGFNFTKSIDRALDLEDSLALLDSALDYSVSVQHKLNLNWSILPFLSTQYSLSIDRDMDAGGDRAAFSNFFGGEGSEGLFARNVLFDYDHTDRFVSVARDEGESIITENLSKRKRKYTADGALIPIIEGDTSTYSPVYDTTWVYTVDSVGNRDYGRSYGILRNERTRSQDFKINFTPMFIPYVPSRFTFGNTFKQAKTIPVNFEFDDPAMVSKNFWSITHTNTFQFNPTIKISDVFTTLKKWKVRDLNLVWNVNLNTTGEDFTLAQLYEQQGVTPFQYYLYGLGLGNGYRSRNPLDIVTGDMLLTNPSQYTRFAQYRNGQADTLVYRSAFLHSVSRQATLGSGLTLPWWDVAVGLDGSWIQEFRQPRDNPYYLDTTTTWPKLGMSVTVPNFSNRFEFLKKNFKSFSTSHRVDYSVVETVRPFQTAEDEWKTVLAFQPLIKISALFRNDIRLENDFHMSFENTLRRPKVQVVASQWWPDSSGAANDTSSAYTSVPWAHADSNIVWSSTVGDELSLAYDLKTKRGFQFFKWYFRLKNNINLKLTTGATYERAGFHDRAVLDDWSPLVDAGEGHRDFVYVLQDGKKDTIRVYNPAFDTASSRIPTQRFHWYIRPSASYEFNKMASMSSFIEYRYTRDRRDDGESHNNHQMQIEIALMLKFD